MSKRGARSVVQQEAMVAMLDAVSRRRLLTPSESELLVELLRLAALRDWWRRRRRNEQRKRAAARLAQLSDDFRSAA